ncbi:hypothetical protein D5086_021051 [Populus alba]|uniref:Uncharacterized protein n=1 Tax=Populus alba TaxID=43335 RepID=A0ACC4BN45_POPAL
MHPQTVPSPPSPLPPFSRSSNSFSSISELEQVKRSFYQAEDGTYFKLLCSSCPSCHEFKGPCKNKAIVVRIDGTLLAPTDYRIIGNAGNWIFFQNVDGVTVSGGVLDGHGSGLWDCKQSGKNCPSGATTLGFSNSNNIVISGLTSLNSQMVHIVINGCNSVKIQGVRVTASGNSPNTDGIHVQLSSNITILSSKIGTGDDCVSIGAGTTNLWIENVVCGPGHGISIGSLGKDLNEPGVQNVTAKTITFIGTQNGLRIKSWGRPSNGFVRNVLFQHAAMNNVQNPIVIDQNYCPDNINCPGQAVYYLACGVSWSPALMIIQARCDESVRVRTASKQIADETNQNSINLYSNFASSSTLAMTNSVEKCNKASKALNCVTALLEGEYGAIYADLEEPEADYRISPLHDAAAPGFLLVLKWFELLDLRI